MSPIFSSSTITTTLLVIGFVLSCSCQNFDPKVDDKEYLDTIQTRLHREAMEAHVELVNQTKILQQVTRTFIETKIRENLFKAVRERVEVELEEMSKNNSVSTNGNEDEITPPSPILSSSSYSPQRQARQDEEDDDDAVTAPTTPRPRNGLLPQLANVVSTLFGADVNVTSYLTDATAFLPPDLSTRIITAASLIDPNRFTSTTIQPPPQYIINGQVIPQGALVNGSTFVYSQVGLPSGVQQSTFIQQGPAGALSQPTNTNTNNNFNSNNNNLGLEPAGGASQTAPQSQQSTLVSQSTSVNGGVPRNQPISNNEIVQQNQNTQQFGTFQQQQTYNIDGNSIAHLGPNPSSQLQQSSSVQNNPVPSFKVNSILPPKQPDTSPASSNEEDDYDNNSSEDDLPFLRDDQASASIGYLDEYPIVKYGLRIFQHFTSRATVPTTTEYMNTTTHFKTLDSIEEEEARATPAATSTYKQAVQTGIAFYEGAREAYQLLQNVNKFLDKVGNRFENAGYGPEDVGVDL